MPRSFQLTRETLIHRAVVLREPRAIAQLRKNYREPLLACARRDYPQLSAEDAGSCVDDVIAEVANDAKRFGYDRSKGRFRNYLFGAVKHRIRSLIRAANAQKRGGEIEHVSLDESPDIPDASADEFPIREWAQHILSQAKERTLAGGGEGGALLYPFLTDPAPDFDKLSAQLGITPSAARKRLDALICEFRKHLRAAVRDDLFTPSEAEVNADLRLLQHHFFL